MNYFKQVAEMLGVKPGEEFKVKWKSGINFTNSKYCFTEEGINEVGTTWFAHGIFADILSGKAEIVKLPWKPYLTEEYYVYSTYTNSSRRARWRGLTEDLLCWKLGNCFKTREEAENKGKEIMEQIEKEFEEE